MFEHRLTERLLSYWNIIKKEDDVPDFSRFNPSAVTDMWQDCLLLDVQPKAPGATVQCTFHSIGEHLRGIYGTEMLGKTVTAAQRHFPGAVILRQMQSVVDSAVPLLDEGQFMNQNSKKVKFRSCLLPFKGKDNRITHLVIGLSWREF